MWTHDPEHFYLLVNRLVVDGMDMDSIVPVDDDVHSVYEYLIGPGEGVL